MDAVKKKSRQSPVEVRPENLPNINNMMTAGLALLQRDAARLGETVGKALHREKNIQTRLSTNAKRVSGIEIAQELAKLNLPPVPEDGALVYGRVADANQRGIADLKIAIHDEKGQPLKSLGASETDAFGYYALSLDAKKIKKLAAFEGSRIVISTPAGSIILREATTIQLNSGDRMRIIFTLKHLITRADKIEYQWVSKRDLQ